jgi:hypothetical protein
MRRVWCSGMHSKWILILTLILTSLLSAGSPSPKKTKTTQCPMDGWSEELKTFLADTAHIPTTEPRSDCDFHEWSWEAFVWATALDKSGTPRFLNLPTPDDLLKKGPPSKKKEPRILTLGARPSNFHFGKSKGNIAGAIVEADGNMLVGKNGYPVYASVHMNSSYLATAKRNLLVDSGYQNNPNSNDYFSPGAAVFKATWMRVNDSTQIPRGAYITKARVPIVKVQNKIAITTGKDTLVTVVLVGLHVVGFVDNHPEFLWGTFEQDLNCPRVPDNTFSDTMPPSGHSFTFYQAQIPYSQVNIQTMDTSAPFDSVNPYLSFYPKTQTFLPTSNVVLENKTGGETFSPQGPQNIENLNKSGKNLLRNLDSSYQNRQKLFSNYTLIGTVWMAPNTYVGTDTSIINNLNQDSGVGSVNLANSTAETFVQIPRVSPPDTVQNCFLCHNATSYSFKGPELKSRRIAISHVLTIGLDSLSTALFGVPNNIPARNCHEVVGGPIGNNQDAIAKCHATCTSQFKWNGQWVTTHPGSNPQSICGCCDK